MSNEAIDGALAPLQDTVKAIYLTVDDLKVAASILYNAYVDDPLFIDIFQAEKEGYENRLRSAIREELNAFWVAEQPMIGLFDEERLIAVACLTAPDAAFGSGRYWHWRLRMLLTAGLFGTKQMLEKEEKVRSLVPADNFHMLSFIAVHPDYQHHGLGHILLGAIDSVVEEDEKSEGVSVFVTIDKHRSFFNDDNYQVVGQLSLSHVKGDVMFRRT
ncbi:GNAT family N-acetyltransferase [Alteromonas gracilis]|jgi:N-acetylglutamate synthase-like GNAT family acetyltransferase|uniref:GNAT family N-acetyltransferase n=1 Tax=Alteromonas gracilis TaxID=1479524 RepID=A0ABX5CJK9_9ALTE|nr:GNAT family N-acetyltransferase [Alteromonas gracilis]PRO67754.1 GNAT family N-acetyltransferase [Alteromonas gracilis]